MFSMRNLESRLISEITLRPHHPWYVQVHNITKKTQETQKNHAIDILKKGQLSSQVAD